MAERTIWLTALLRREEDQWTALCLEFDIAAHGDTEREAVESLKEQVDEYARHLRARGKRLHEIYRPVPPEAIRELIFGTELAREPKIIKTGIHASQFEYA